MNTPATTFHDLGVDATLADALASKGIVHPFPIQELTLPMALKGADLIGQARTGTGKTLAFGLPLLQRIDPDRKQTQALVIVPTRELCLQVADDLTVGAERGVTSIAIYGGVGYDEQIEALTSGVHVVIGTPGRTLDHLNRGNLDLSGVHVVVLDEADEMLDMGFLPDVERLLIDVPEERQTLLFSATMPAVIVKLARRFMTKPTFMRAESEERQTASTVEQHFFLVHRMDKPRVLARLLQTEGRGGAFVFTRTKNMADRLVRELEDLQVKAIAVHGDLRQATREKNLDRFRAGKADVLVATEVAARGLDVDNVTHVVNYDCPDDDKMYLHRIGRTARAGSSGVAVTFAEFNEVDRLSVIRKAVQADGEPLELFSTSDELTKLFDLPEQTPWDHMTRSTGTTSRAGAGSSRGSSPRGGSDGRASARSSSDNSGSRQGKRTSSTDGRGKSRRGSDGSRPASRERTTSPPSRERTTSPPAHDSSGDTGGSRERTRTRTRERARDTGSATPSGDRGASTTSDDHSPKQAGDTGTSRDGGSRSGRTRARRSRGGGGSSGSGRVRARTDSGSARGESQATDKGSSREPQDTGSSAGDGGRDKGGRDSRRRSTGGNRARGGSERNGGGSSRDDGSRRNGGGSSRGRPATGTDDIQPLMPKGAEARGEGTPRPRRNVEVEVLP